MFCGLLIGIVGYAILAYLSFMSSGYSVAEIWTDFHFVSCPFGYILSPLGWVLWILGVLFFLAVFLLTSTVVSKITVEQIQGNDFYEIKEGLKFLKETWKAVLLSPVTIALFIIFLIICGIIAGLWGKIPWLGELSLTLFSIPILFVAILIVYLFVNFVVSLIFSPSIVGTTKTDTFDTIFEVFSSLNSQPWRLLVYEVLLCFVIVVGFLLMGFLTWGGLALSQWAIGLFMGDKLIEIVEAAKGYLPISGAYPGPSPLWLTPFFPGTFGMTGLGWARTLSAFFLGISLNLLFLIVYAYALSMFSVGQTLIYGVIVKKKDDKNIFEKKEEKWEEEKPIPAEAPKEEAKVETTPSSEEKPQT